MSRNKNSQYFKYAIGEILLVVIGILLALQINNWNEDHKRQKLKTNYINSLLEDLNQDSVMVSNQIDFYMADTTIINQYVKRIKQHPERDTLVKIARYEFNTNVNIITAFSNKTYNTLINTGDIDLLEPWLVEDLSRLDQLQKLAVSVYDLSITSYSEILQQYRQHLTVFDDALAGDLLDPIWNELSYEEILKQFNVMATSKLTTGTNVLQFLPIYLQIINDLDARIREAYNIEEGS